MRLGQLIEMVALLASEESPVSTAEVEDGRLIEAARRHLQVRRQQLEGDDRSEQDRPPPAPRVELLHALERLHDRQSGWRFGDLVGRLAAASGSSLYDIEDEQLLAAVRGHTANDPED
jgi:hypothetical protein